MVSVKEEKTLKSKQWERLQETAPLNYLRNKERGSVESYDHLRPVGTWH